MDWSTSTWWWIAAGALVVGELATGTFYVLMLAIGCVFGALAGYAQISFFAQVAVAVVVGGAAVLAWDRKRKRGPARVTAAANRDINLDIGEQVQVDGILYFQVTDAMRASYGSSNYVIAITQLCQSTLRSVIGKMELDKTFEERDLINGMVVNALDDAASNWGVKVLRYEIKDLTPPAEILRAMQAQITAEREKRALIAASEGRRQEQINIATGQREASIARSEGEKQAEINKAQGEAAAIVAVADATADAIRKIAEAIRAPGGEQAVQLKVAERAVDAYQSLAKTNNTMIVPGNMTEVSSLIATAMALIKSSAVKPG